MDEEVRRDYQHPLPPPHYALPNPSGNLAMKKEMN